MSEFTHSGGENRAPREHDTPILSRAPSPGNDGVPPPSSTSRFRARVTERADRAEESMQRMGKKVKKGFKTFLGIRKPKNTGEGDTSAQDVVGDISSQSTEIASGLAEKGGAHNMKEDVERSRTPAPGMARSAVNESMSAPNTSKVWAIAKGTFKNALVIAAALVPEPFKGPAEALLKVVDVIEKADSNKEEVEILKKRCDLLGSSVVNAVKGKDTKLLSEDLKHSIGRLVVGIWDTLEAANKGKSTGFTAYILAEDDAEVLKNVNKKLDELLQCFWIENHIAGSIVLSDILATVQDHTGWMQGLSATLDKHFENSTLNQLKQISGAAYDSLEIAAKIVPCFEGTRSTLLAKIGHWMSRSISDGHNPPLHQLSWG
ncbi:hypothetical protein EST38_g12212 [Candolleomyces aberdarensis]|uniref:Uncharacterized protein n=1 Tax=Candolleomyces aberdarensis TaxID=2316362 RepID=A0A4Q2D313_9AGAR|nr:hypothetical protein EST38_g12212 [Candolleomyces aberdarensis]